MAKKTATRKLVVSNPTGIHARPSLAIVNTVRQFKSQVEIRKDSQVVNAGEILQVMSLGAAQGTELELTARGPDADKVLDALERLFQGGFGL